MATTKISGNLIKTATITGNNIANGTITTNNISTSVNLGGPKITTITYPGDDTAADTAGGQTVVLTGNGFATGASVLLDGVAVGSVTVTNTSSISFTSPAKSTGSYIVYVVNTDGSTAILVPGIQYSGLPAYSTSAGSLGSAYEYAAVSSTIAATGDAPVTFSLYSGSLPDGVTLASNGQLSGTTSAQSGNTTFSFTVRATDAQNQETDRAFSVTINIDAVTWSAPANNATITTYEYATISNTFVSTSAAGRAVTYSANVLPANVSITGSTVSGTPTTIGNTTSLITATANTTGRTSTQVLNFVVQQDVVTWSSPANNVTYTLAQNVANTTSLAATSAAGQTVTFAANSLPAGLAVSGNTITGTPTTAGNSSSLITATAAVTNRTAVQTINWVIQLAADAHWKYTAMLVGGTSNTVSNTFIQDASLKNTQLTVVGDTKPNNFNPYTQGYYSLYSPTYNDGYYYTDNNVFGTGDFTVEWWGFSTNATVNWIVAGATSGNWQVVTYLDGFYWQENGGNLTNMGFVVPKNQWVHFAITRTGGYLNVYINGTRQFNALNSYNYSTAAVRYIGQAAGGSNNPAWISNLRIIRGTGIYSGTTISVPTGPLTSVANTTLLTCQSPRMIDNSPSNTQFTAYGSPQISSYIPFAANTSYAAYGSAYFDGTGDYLQLANTTAPILGQSSATVEFWIYPKDITDYRRIVTATISGFTAGAFCIRFNNGNILAGDSGGNAVTTSGMPIILNHWNHVAWVGTSGTSQALYVNGVNVGTSTSYNLTTAIQWIGGYYTTGPAEYTNGYLSDVRITKGTALYTANFTPPTALLTANANTQLLTCQYNGGATNNGFVDQSGINNIITRTGNPTQGTFSPHSPNGWSAYLDGSSTYYFPANAAINIGAGAFTIEGWVNIPTGTNNKQFVCGSILIGAGGYGGSTVGALRYYDGITAVGSASYLVATGTWNHFAIVRENTSTNGLKMYVNGILVYVGTSTANPGNADTYIGAVNTSTDLLTGYISNVRWVKGTAVYTTASTTVGTQVFTPSTTPLTAIANTTLLTAQSNRFVDNSPYNFTPTVSNTPKAQAYSPFGGVTSAPISYSNYFDGSGDYLSFPGVTIGTNAYTIDFWFNINNFNATYATLSTSNSNALNFRINSSTSFAIDKQNVDQAGFAVPTMSTGVWYHVAVVRNASNVCTVFLNGTRSSTGVATITHNYSGVSNYIGEIGGNYFPGYISNLRVVVGSALYDPTASSITVPTSPLTVVANTQLLTCRSSTIVDNSSNYHTITANGNTQPYAYNPFGMTNTTPVTYTPSVNGGSMYFDGSGDYLTAGTFSPGTTNFTVECWFYPTAWPSSQGELYTTPWGGNNFQLMINSGGTIQWQAYDQSMSAVSLAGLNQWYHVAVVKNGSSAYFYLNGVLRNTSALTNSISGTAYVGARGADALYFIGYISDLRASIGSVLYTSNFYPGTAPATPITTIGTATYSSTLLLNGTNGGIIDAHGSNNLETVGNTQLVPQDPYSGRYYSNYFDGSGDYLSIPTTGGQLDFTGDFTTEMWVYWTTMPTTGYQNIAGQGTGGQNSYGLMTGNPSSDTWSAPYRFKLNVANVGDVLTGNTTLVAGQWYHLAHTRTSGVNRLFVDGTLQTNTYTDSTSRGFGGNPYTIGNSSNCYISNFRYIKGTSLYTANFTPSTSPLTAVANTQLLTCQSYKFADNSTNALTVTPTGNAAVKSINPFQQNPGKSLYFDGTGDYLLIPNSPNLNPGADSFTIEFWIYYDSIAGYQTPLSKGYTASNELLLQTGNGNGTMIIYISGSAVITESSAATPGQWYYYALVRNGTELTLYRNGVSVGTATNSVDITNTYQLGVGATGKAPAGGSIGQYPINGYIKDLRITKGVARYTTGFTPPSEPMIAK